ncbi:hypothetical protein Fot_42381 [Forsythia ovata]|uniref:Uncharacterized protein n=1 Tax=Forsythia ovata TaxID=205694 RepID=A0ABD1RM00_9LAMI
MASFHFSKIHVFKIRDGRVVDERGTLHSRLLILSTAPILASTVLPVVEVVGGVSSSLPTPGTASVPVATVLPMIGINIGSRQDELDSAILDHISQLWRLPLSINIGLQFGQGQQESADLLELIKMAEMNTARSHVLNCEAYKMLAMKVDELRSMVVGTDDIDDLRSENNVLRARLVIFEDARAQAVFQLTKS